MHENIGFVITGPLLMLDGANCIMEVTISCEGKSLPGKTAFCPQMGAILILLKPLCKSVEDKPSCNYEVQPVELP